MKVMANKRRPERFSVVSAVKANARARVGQPPPERSLPDAKQRAERRATRYKKPLGEVLASVENA